jgi:hypothetical protein
MTGARFTPSRVYEPVFFSIGSHDNKYRDRIGTTSPSTPFAWVANLALFVPFTISQPVTVMEWWWINATLTTAHNIDFGIYNEDFTKRQTMGSTVGATTASVLVNTSTWANLDIPAGSYYMAMSDDSIRNIVGSADPLGIYASEGCFEQSASSFPLPATATPIIYGRAFLPNFGMHCMTTVP